MKKLGKWVSSIFLIMTVMTLIFAYYDMDIPYSSVWLITYLSMLALFFFTFFIISIQNMVKKVRKYGLKKVMGEIFSYFLILSLIFSFISFFKEGSLQIKELYKIIGICAVSSMSMFYFQN